MQSSQIKMRLGLVVVARVEAETVGRPKGAMMDIRDEQTAARPAMRWRADMGVTNRSRRKFSGPKPRSGRRQQKRSYAPKP